MRESLSLSSGISANQTTANAFSSIPPASEMPIPSTPDLRSNQDILESESSETPPKPCTVLKGLEKDAAAASAAGSAETAISKVEAVIESVIDGMLHRQSELAIPIRVKKKQQSRILVELDYSPPSSLPTTGNPPASPAAWTRVLVKFPGRDGRESWRFSVLWRILGLVHQALMLNSTVSKRNIYYKDPALFKSQRVVDRYIDILAYSLGVQRAALNVTAAAKGLVAGKFTVTRKDGTGCPGWSGSATMLIDEVEGILSIDTTGVTWVLVIEKESTFRTLASSKFHHTCKAGPGIIVTAKGYPDLSTRAFLHHLSMPPSSSSDGGKPSPRPLPIYALMDFDPDGISILSTYKHGSWTLSHENANHNVRSIRWLGLQSSDLLRSTDHDDREGDERISNGKMAPASSDHSSSSESSGAELLRLSLRDRKKATGMLKRDLLRESEGWSETAWRRELQVMLMLGYKAEMEFLGEREGGLEAWLQRRLIVGNKNG